MGIRKPRGTHLPAGDFELVMQVTVMAEQDSSMEGDGRRLHLEDQAGEP